MTRKRILIAGGLGFVGSRLVRKLITDYDINILDTGWFWNDWTTAKNELSSGTGRIPQIFIGDMRGKPIVKRAMLGCDAAILLSCISNDPTSELAPNLCNTINHDATLRFMDLAQEAKLERFIYASSSSVYGIQPEELEVTEDVEPAPLTLYSRLKLNTEKRLRGRTNDGLINGIIVRPATVCGYSPRQRLDLVANIFVDQAVNGGFIRVTGGNLFRPLLGISRMVDCYRFLLDGYLPDLVGQTFNVGGPNLRVREIAELVQESVRRILNKTVDIEETETNDNRSYRINSNKIESYGFKPYNIHRDIEELILQMDLYNKHKGTPNEPVMNLEKSRNISVMKELIAGGLE